MNKKVKNATVYKHKDITFKSHIEATCYEMLCDAGFEPQYEKMKVIIWKGFKPHVDCYEYSKKTKILKNRKREVLDISYTPDFTFIYHQTLIIIETKGIPTDDYLLKKKLFRGWLEKLTIPCVFFEVHTRKNIEQAIEIIKTIKEK